MSAGPTTTNPDTHTASAAATPDSAADSPTTGTLWSADFCRIDQIAGPLLVVSGVTGVAYGEIVTVLGSGGDERRGQVLELDGDRAVVQVLGAPAVSV